MTLANWIHPLLFAGSDPYADYLVYDTFTDVNGTALNAHTPDKDSVGGGWSYDAGTAFTINANQLDVGPEVPCRAIIDAGQADIKINGTLITPGDDGFQILLRWQDDDNYIRALFELIPMGSIAITKWVAGVPTSVDDLITGIFGARTIDFEITAIGNAIVLKDLTNSKTCSGTVNELQTNTIVGLGDSGAETGPMVVDNFSVAAM